jgi:hypothetical protein
MKDSFDIFLANHKINQWSYPYDDSDLKAAYKQALVDLLENHLTTRYANGKLISCVTDEKLKELLEELK